MGSNHFVESRARPAESMNDGTPTEMLGSCSVGDGVCQTDDVWAHAPLMLRAIIRDVAGALSLARRRIPIQRSSSFTQRWTASAAERTSIYRWPLTWMMRIRWSVASDVTCLLRSHNLFMVLLKQERTRRAKSMRCNGRWHGRAQRACNT